MSNYNPDTFTVTGSGFTPGGSVLIKMLYSNGIGFDGAYTTADGSGNINTNITSDYLTGVNYSGLISGGAGTYYGGIEALDLSTNKISNTVDITVTVVTSARLSVSPSTTNYNRGGTVTFTGTGFAPNSTINFAVNYTAGYNVLPATTTTDSNGNFSIGFGYPGGGVLDGYMSENTGTFTMIAVDSAGNIASASWYNNSG